MALSAFDNKSKKPKASDLKRVLGRTSTYWDELTDHLAAEFAPLDETWNYGGANWGWSLRLKQKKRTILYMTPCEGHFLIGFVLGDKAVKAAHQSNLPESVIGVIDEAKKYVEGKAVRIEIRAKKDIAITKKLAKIKMGA